MRLAFAFILLWNVAIEGQAPIDVQHYRLELAVSDSTNMIHGEATITLCFRQDAESVSLDLVGKGNDGTGIVVGLVNSGGDTLSFHQTATTLTVMHSGKTNDCATMTINYSGIPADGLIIGNNKYGGRTFFADNWPNRARHWFPCMDHPSDKATFEFVVSAPSQYQVIANGRLLEETNLSEETMQFHWKTEVPLPTKVAVIGIARFAVQHLDAIHGIPASSWVYPQDREAGFYDFAIAGKVLAFFIEKIGPYPFSKSASVQSKTRFGGMENAGNVFYSEQSVTGERRHEALIAHELAHQWFGNSATETDWAHLWLSEGFATCLTNLYIEHVYGFEAFRARRADMKRTVIQFAQRRRSPVVDTATKDYMDLLNPNSYQKGGFVLHMLRRHVGDEVFWEILRTYYQRYAFANADTRDFQHVCEQVSGQDLQVFFDQWLYRAGHPKIELWHQYLDGLLTLTVDQLTPEPFVFALELEVQDKSGRAERANVEVHATHQTFEIPLDITPEHIEPDPDHHLLVEFIPATPGTND